MPRRRPAPAGSAPPPRWWCRRRPGRRGAAWAAVPPGAGGPGVVRWWWSPIAPSVSAGNVHGVPVVGGRSECGATARDVDETPRAAAPARCRPSAVRLDAVDDLLRRVPCIRGDRRAAGGVGRGLLALLADHVGLERLERGGLGLVVVLGAADVVADQHDRVLVGRRG